MDTAVDCAHIRQRLATTGPAKPSACFRISQTRSTAFVDDRAGDMAELNQSARQAQVPLRDLERLVTDGALWCDQIPSAIKPSTAKV